MLSNTKNRNSHFARNFVLKGVPGICGNKTFLGQKFFFPKSS